MLDIRTKDETNEKTIIKDMFEMAEAFCVSAKVYCYCYNAKSDLLTSYQGETEESQMLSSIITPSVTLSLLSKFKSHDMDNVIEQQLEMPCAKMTGIAIRDDDGILLGIGIIVGIIEDLITEDMFIPKAIARTSLEDYGHAIAHFETLTRHYFHQTFEILRLENSLEEMSDTEEKMETMLKHNEALTEIFKLLESEQEFERIAKEILKITGQYLKISCCLLLKTDDRTDSVDIVSESCLSGVRSMNENFSDKKIFQFPFFNGRPYTISSETMIPDEFTRFFIKYGITAGVFLPLSANERLGMYLCFIMKDEDRQWSIEETRFLNDVKRVLQSILTKRITKNSLASSYTALEDVLGNVKTGIVVIDATSHRRLYTNEAYTSLLDDREDRLELEQFLNREGDDVRSFYAKNTRRWVEITFAKTTWVDGRAAKICTLYDVTQLIDYQKKIEEQSNIDALTCIYNRKRCQEDVDAAIKQAVRSATSGALIYLGLDDFKNINEGLGHISGDELLRQVSSALLMYADENTRVYRAGGDEFAILVTGEAMDNLSLLIQKVQDLFAHTWDISDAQYYCTTSMSVVRFPEDGYDADTLFRRSDLALNLAKNKGKNRVEYYSVQTGDSTLRRLDMEKCMRKAIQEGCAEFEIYYQPLMDLSGDKHICCGAEALIRWNSPELGFLTPNEFIPLAEYLGLIVPIGEHVLKTATKRCKFWNDFGHPEYKVNVNLSVIQLLQRDIVGNIKDALKESNLNPKNLTIEVTESLAIHDMKSMSKVLNDIKALGVRVALDDFGTGYSALSHIRTMPIDVIKIDRSFVKDLDNDEFSKAFIKSVSDLADSLNMNVCAEGVETNGQINVLDEMQVDIFQGFIFDKPLSQSEFEEKYVD